MSDLSFLAYLRDPFGVHATRFLLRDAHGHIGEIDASQLCALGMPIMTVDSPALVDDLRRTGHPPPDMLLDLGEALRLFVGRSKDDGGEKLWDVWRALVGRFDRRADAKRFHSLVLSRSDHPDAEQIARLLSEALSATIRLWNDLKSELERVDEYSRLVSVEWPIQGLFAYRQFRGVKVDSDCAANLLRKIDEEKYAAYRTVASVLGKSPTGLNFWNVSDYLADTDVSHLADIQPGGRLQDAFKLAAQHSEFAAAFTTMVRASRDETIVRRALGGEDRLFPIFSVMGTVSGRILVSDPYLQQLRRKYRALVAAETDMKLVYLDFAQFEPGVLAALCDDEALIAEYNNGDLYTALAERLFSDHRARPIAKRVFLAFSYGMSADRISLVLNSPDLGMNSRETVAETVSAFFARYPGLERFRAEQQAKLSREGYVSSAFGNRRVRSLQGALTNKEGRWALNQPVQSTASLIFKEALIDLEQAFQRDSIVLPVHDAVLMQFADNEEFESTVERAKALMVSTFRHRFPQIEPRVTDGPFAS